MKKLLRTIILLCLGIVSIELALGQDMNYSQYFSAPIYYNPAFTGINTGLRARFLFRDQWPVLPVDFKSYYFSADIGDRGLPGAGGFGIQINSDNPGVGLINNLQAALTIGVRIPITGFMAAQVGVKAAVLQRKVSWDDFVYTKNLDPIYGNIYQTDPPSSDINKWVVTDFAAGGILQFINPEGTIGGNIGFAVDHLFKPDVSFLSTGTAAFPRKWIGHADVIFSSGPGGSPAGMYSGAASDPLRIQVGALYQNQGETNCLEAGLNLQKFNIYIGGWYKSTLTGLVNSSIVLLAGYKYRFYEGMSLGFIYSYDLQVSGALQGTGGAHEISLVLEFENASILGGGGRRGGGGFVPGGGGRRYGGPMECPTFY